jgi:hypothetical protein
MDVLGADTYTQAVAAFGSDPSGWTGFGERTGGTGTANDSHTSRIKGWYRELAGGDANPTVTQTGGGGLVATVVGYTKGAGQTWVTPVTVGGTDDTHGADRSVSSTATIAVQPGDRIVAIVAVDTDLTTSPSAQSITASGITFGTCTKRTTGAGSTGGTDGNVEIFDAEVTAGTGTVTLTFSMTLTTLTCGPVTFLRLRATGGATEFEGWGIPL